MSHVAVLGAGSWGTAFSRVLVDAGNTVSLWARREDVAREIRETGRNASYLPDLDLSPDVSATSRVEAALEGAEAVVLAVPAQSLRANLETWPALPQVPIVSLLKGIETGTHLRMSQVVARAGGVDEDLVAIVSGPNLAREIAARQPAASVIAGRDSDVARRVTLLCSAPYFRPYVSSDVVGVEIAGAVKNVIALAVGIAHGTGLGDNTKATLITRGLAEIARLGVALGADPDTFPGLAGMGDLVATCASPLSRNQRVGAALGRGLTLEEARAEVGQTAEGVTSAAGVLSLAEDVGVDMPITRAVVGVVHHGYRVRDVTAALLARPLKEEGYAGGIAF